MQHHWRTLYATFWLLLGFALFSQSACADDSLITVNTRDGQTISYWWMPAPQATQTVLLFSGSQGGIGYHNGEPRSANFLIRSREYFRAQGFNVALLGNPSDAKQMDDAWRTSSKHTADIQAVLTDIQPKSNAPVWLIGTSRGTISVASQAVPLQKYIAGIVLSSSVTDFNTPAALPHQNLKAIQRPVLVFHHQNDACRITQARETSWIMDKLTNATPAKRLIVTGGKDPSGNPCEAMHWHGFIGMEAEAVQMMGDWIKHPTP